MNETEDNKKDDKGSVNEDIDEGTGVKEIVDSKEEKENVEAKKPELDAMEEEGVTKDKDENSEKEKIQEEEDEDEDKVDNSKEEEKAKDSKAEKGSKRRGKGKINEEKVNKKRKELKETEPRTPAINRPVRERKSVERLVASIEKDATKEFHIEKVFIFSFILSLNCVLHQNLFYLHILVQIAGSWYTFKRYTQWYGACLCLNFSFHYVYEIRSI